MQVWALGLALHDFKKESCAMSDPRHIAIIMDGNGRWAKARGLPRSAGHRAGVEALREIVRAAEIAASAILRFCFLFRKLDPSERRGQRSSGAFEALHPARSGRASPQQCACQYYRRAGGARSQYPCTVERSGIAYPSQYRPQSRDCLQLRFTR